MSILLQRGNLSYKVTLVDDCSNESYDDIIAQFQEKIDIQYLRLSVNSGGGLARQYGIDHTKLPYIVFLDAYDLFYNCDSLYTLYSYIIRGYDMVSGSEWVEEKKGFFVNEGDLHGKMYRRQYILNHHVTFNNTRFHEDNYFNSFMLLSGAYNINLPDVTYLYCDNQESITKKNSNKEFECLEILISNMKELFDLIPITTNNKGLFKQFIFMKFKYFNRLYTNFTKQEKSIFSSWIMKYFPNFISFVGVDDISELEKMVCCYFDVL